ncbi:MAG: fucose isomerase, partial [Planctomycetes bacterium]|nr:fucose isomerase [Planctomycetota bacterium]
DELAREGRETMIQVLKKHGYGVVCLDPRQTKHGAVETHQDAKQCAELFAKNRDKIAGIVVSLPNFGDEKGVADSLQRSGLNVPVLIHAFSDDPAKMSIKFRRDSFCGKLSACNNLNQYNIPFTLTTRHTDHPDSPVFAQDLSDFAVTCRVVRALNNVRIGAVGARPAAFNTCRFSEKLFQDSGISVETLDLSEVMGRADKLKATDAKVKARVAALQKYVPCPGTPKVALERMARLAIVLDEWIRANDISALALQCWTAMEEFFGVVPCTVMSHLSQSMIPAACEVDIPGAVGMYILQAASGTPSALLDWNNNYGEDPDRAVMFHCSNLPASFFRSPTMGYQDIIAGSVGKDNTYGTVVGKIAAGPATFLRLSTDDFNGTIAGYAGEGEFTDDPLDTFGGAGVIRIDNLQELLRYICEQGFEHHVAASKSQVADGVVEALTTYLGWDIYQH